jgi:hypothetical protein
LVELDDDAPIERLSANAVRTARSSYHGAVDILPAMTGTNGMRRNLIQWQEARRSLSKADEDLAAAQRRLPGGQCNGGARLGFRIGLDVGPLIA